MHIESFIERHRLAPDFWRTARDIYIPLARWVDEALKKHSRGTFVLGINGAQGTGKSTLSEFLAEYLAAELGRSTAVLSLDDLYLTRAERQALARTVHPLLATRGVPGTHDVGLGIRVLDALGALGAGEQLALPRFDKAVDDRRSVAEWPVVRGAVELVIFEGWCVCSEAVPDAELDQPVNALEAAEDSDGAWRRFVNEQLASVYPALFSRVDALVFLAAPGFDAIRRWRFEQERKLIANIGNQTKQTMDGAGIERFVRHFERVTRQDLERLPCRADVVLELGSDHTVTAVRYRSSPESGAIP